MAATESDEEVSAMLIPSLQYFGTSTSSPDDTLSEEDQATIEEAKRVIEEEIDADTALVGPVKLQIFLRYFLSESPNPIYAARALLADYVSKEPKLRNIQGEKKYLAIARVWFERFIKFLKTLKAKDSTPEPSAAVTPSTRSTAKIVKRGTRSQTELTKWLLDRDGNRDTIRRSLSYYANGFEPSFKTVSAHIIPFSSAHWEENKSVPVHKKIFWDILRNWASFDIKKLQGDLINRPANALTLEAHDDFFFGNMDLWLEATTAENEYYLRVKNPVTYPYPEALQRTITFRNYAPYEVELPMPALLRIHAAAARVLHLSGAGDYLDRIERERGLLNSSVLASDGSSMEVFSEVLRGSIVSVEA